MRVTFLLADTALFGGVRVVLHFANLLHRAGHRVVVASPGELPDWYALEAEFLRLRELAAEELPPADVTFATYWTTLEAAYSVPSGQAVHYCQGFEGGLTHNRAEHPAIERAYARQIPAVVVSPHLGRLVRGRFSRPFRVVPPAVEAGFRPRRRLGPHRLPLVMVMSPFEFYMKGVDVALLAVAELRRRGIAVRLRRLSQLPLSDAERGVCEADEFFCSVAPSEVPSLLADCDLLLAPSWEQEGFGLPVLEAMASGVPVVASDIPAFRHLAGAAAALVPARDANAFAEAATSILGDRGRWRAMRKAGLARAADYSEAVSLSALESALEWAVSGAWRSEA